MSAVEHAQESLEHVHHAQHGHGAGHHGPVDHFPTYVGVLVATLAVALALTDAEMRDVNDVYMTNHIAVSDTWAFFQAKNVRQTNYLTTVEILESMPNQDAEIRKRIDRMKLEASRMADDPQGGEGRKQLAAKAAEQTKIRDAAHRRGEQYDQAAGILQISIVMASVSVVTKIKALGAIAAVIGIGAATYSLFITFGAH